MAKEPKDEFIRIPGKARQYGRREADGSITVYPRREVDRARKNPEYIPTPIRIIPKKAADQPIVEQKVGKGGRKPRQEPKEQPSTRGIGGGHGPDFPPEIRSQDFPASNKRHTYFDVTAAYNADALADALQKLADAIPGSRWFIGIDHTDKDGEESSAQGEVRKKGDIEGLLTQLRKLRSKTYVNAVTKVWCLIAETRTP